MPPILPNENVAFMAPPELSGPPGPVDEAPVPRGVRATGEGPPRVGPSAVRRPFARVGHGHTALSRGSGQAEPRPPHAPGSGRMARGHRGIGRWPAVRATGEARVERIGWVAVRYRLDSCTETGWEREWALVEPGWSGRRELSGPEVDEGMRMDGRQVLYRSLSEDRGSSRAPRSAPAVLRGAWSGAVLGMVVGVSVGARTGSPVGLMIGGGIGTCVGLIMGTAIGAGTSHSDGRR